MIPILSVWHPSYRPESSLHFSGENPAKWDMISESVNWIMKDAKCFYLIFEIGEGVIEEGKFAFPESVFGCLFNFCGKSRRHNLMINFDGTTQKMMAMDMAMNIAMNMGNAFIDSPLISMIDILLKLIYKGIVRG